jgi:hypothetical protein
MKARLVFHQPRPAQPGATAAAAAAALRLSTAGMQMMRHMLLHALANQLWLLAASILHLRWHAPRVLSIPACMQYVEGKCTRGLP